MLIAEYDYATDIAIQRAEAWQEGLTQGINQGKHDMAKKLKTMKIAPEKIVQVTGLSLQEIENL